MYKIKFLSIAVTLAIIAGGIAYAEDWKVGEKWIYKHEGPRPHSNPPTTIKGDRTIEVTAIQDDGAAKRYLLKTVWGTEDASPSTSYIDPNNLIHKLDIQYTAVLLFDPPVPAFWPLKSGEQTTLKTNMDVSGYKIPMEYIVKCLKDETITVPAGKFENCRRFEIISFLQNEMLQPIKVKMDHWYHPKIKNFVKEVTIINYESDSSYTGTSILKSHTIPK
jgi:hypothetical protein